jgi:hypothetical protein
MTNETLEEAAEKYANAWEEIHPQLDWQNMTPIEASKIDFIEGAKWQAERMYSEEEVIDFLQEMNDWPTTFDGRIDIREWFEKIKKK